MKKAFFIVALLLSGFAIEKATAQVRVNINIGSQPTWGPVGYDHVDYYYMPDIDAYYNVPTRQYYYFDRGRWVSAYALPPVYSNYDVYNSYKVVVNDPYPYRHAEMYRVKYAGYKNRHDQMIIRNSHEEKYYQIKDHPDHDKWKEDKHDKWKDDKRDNRDNGNHKNKGRGKGRD